MKKFSSIFICTLIASFLLNSCKKADEVVRNTSNNLADIYATLEGKGSERLFLPRYSAAGDTIYFDLPYFYPVNSDNAVDLSKIIMRSTVPADYKVSPMLGTIMDVSKSFRMDITSGSGEVRSFVVVTKKVGDVSVTSAKVNYTAGGLPQEVHAVVKDSEILFYILPGTDVSNVVLDLEINKHSTSSIATGTSINLSQDVPLTITGVDGLTKTYTLKATEPVKLNYGVGINRRLWTKTGLDLGFNTINETSIAISGDYLVLVSRTNPARYRLYDRNTGVYVKDLAVPFGGLAMMVAHDINGTLIGATYAAKGAKLLIYKWPNGVDQAPEKLIEWTNTGNATGRRLNIYGDLSTNAVITSPADQSTNINKWVITNGQLVSNTPEIIDYKSLAGGAASKMGFQVDAQPISATPNTNYFLNYQHELALVNGVSHERMTAFANETAVYGVFHFATDYIEFNNAKYLAIQKFTNWNFTTAILGLYDVTETSKITLSAADPRYNTFNIYNSEIFTGGPNGNGTGDVCIALSPDKERMQVFMLTTNGGIIAHEFTKYAP